METIVSVFTTIVSNVVSGMQTLIVPGLGISFWSLYVAVFVAGIGFMVLRAFFRIGDREDSNYEGRRK